MRWSHLRLENSVASSTPPRTTSILSGGNVALIMSLMSFEHAGVISEGLIMMRFLCDSTGDISDWCGPGGTGQLPRGELLAEGAERKLEGEVKGREGTNDTL